MVKQLLAGGAVRRAKLGLAIAEVATNDPSREREPALGSRPAVRVEEVATGSPAERAALKRGDLIVAVNGQPVGDPSAFAAAITGDDPLVPAAAVKLTLLRDGAEHAARVETTGE